MHVNLLPHPSTPCELVESVEVFVERDANALTLRYLISGMTDGIVLPERRSPERQDELWQHTCFELFARASGTTQYCEINFSPSTQWAAYEFVSYRAGMKRLPYPAPPLIYLTHDSSHISLAVDVDYSALAAAAPGDLRLALAAVIEQRDGRKSYWALTHPVQKPDFHHPDAFTLSLPHGIAR